jgi:hypothetical protein
MSHVESKKDFPLKLYKYLPSKYNNDFLKGIILFRNFTWFRQFENGLSQRGDFADGSHRDNPNNDKVCTDLYTGRIHIVDASSSTSINQDEIYIFCLSTKLDQKLFDDFETDNCIEIFNIPIFIRRIKSAITQLHYRNQLLTNYIYYYNQAERPELNPDNPRHLAFFKDEKYEHQEEYRLAFAKKKIFTPKKTPPEKKFIMNHAYQGSLQEDAMKGIPKKKVMSIFDISDIAKIHYKPRR